MEAGVGGGGLPCGGGLSPELILGPGVPPSCQRLSLSVLCVALCLFVRFEGRPQRAYPYFIVH